MIVTLVAYNLLNHGCLTPTESEDVSPEHSILSRGNDAITTKTMLPMTGTFKIWPVY